MPGSTVSVENSNMGGEGYAAPVNSKDSLSVVSLNSDLVSALKFFLLQEALLDWGWGGGSTMIEKSWIFPDMPLVVLPLHLATWRALLSHVPKFFPRIKWHYLPGQSVCSPVRAAPSTFCPGLLWSQVPGGMAHPRGHWQIPAWLCPSLWNHFRPLSLLSHMEGDRSLKAT